MACFGLSLLPEDLLVRCCSKQARLSPPGLPCQCSLERTELSKLLESNIRTWLLWTAQNTSCSILACTSACCVCEGTGLCRFGFWPICNACVTCREPHWCQNCGIASSMLANGQASRSCSATGGFRCVPCVTQQGPQEPCPCLVFGSCSNEIGSRVNCCKGSCQPNLASLGDHTSSRKLHRWILSAE